MPTADNAARITTRAADWAARVTTGVIPDRAARLVTRARDLAVRVATGTALTARSFTLEYGETCEAITVIFTVDGLPPVVPYMAVVTNQLENRVQFANLVTVVGNTVRVLFNSPVDGLFRVQLYTDVLLADVRFAGLCRVSKCWRKENARMAASKPTTRGEGPSDRWKQLTAVLGVAEAAAGVGDYGTAQDAIDFLTNLCAEEGCGCASC